MWLNCVFHLEELFHLRGMMSYGSFLGDGSERGPDYTAEALHQFAVAMTKYYENQMTEDDDIKYGMAAIKARVADELRNNAYNAEKNVIEINEAQIFAWNEIVKYYEIDLPKSYKYIVDANNIKDLSAFFYWGAWLSAAARPGENYSYTHNWPHEPLVGNVPTPAVILWSAISVLILWLGLMSTLYVYGQVYRDEYNDDPITKAQPLTTQDLENNIIHPTQLQCYKFFVLSMIGFLIQVLAGVACAIDFVVSSTGGWTLWSLIPYQILRSYHAVFQIYWFFVAWVGTTIWFLPRFYKSNQTPNGQKFLIDLLFIGCLIVAVGGIFGIPLGQSGYLQGEMAYLFGSQGWEFMELGRVFQNILLCGFVLWIIILFRGVYQYITWNTIWSTPAWLFYGSLVMVWFLFFSLKVTPKSNFIVSGFWRWMVVHMWVEVTFEVFTTVIVAFLYREMGLVSKRSAERATYIAVMLFFLTATIGVGHNFYWIAKPTGVIALGSAFSTTQVIPLILLTLDAWKFIQMHEKAKLEVEKGNQKHIMKGVWLFMLGVNFWNIFGAGILGSFINLPVVNYYMHSTYLTGNHAHSAMWGVKGNIAIAGMLFCVQHSVKKEYWSDRLVSIAFWSLNGGIALMMFMSLFPIGLLHMYTCMDQGLWAARTHELYESFVFQTLSKARAIGGHLFLWGGLFPIVYFVISRYFYLKSETKMPIPQNKQSFWLDAKHTAPYQHTSSAKKVN